MGAKAPIERETMHDVRLILWIAKWFYPEINTKKTRLLVIPPGRPRYYLPLLPEPGYIKPIDPFAIPEREAVDIQKFGYKSHKRNHWFVIRFGYSKRLDTLLFMDGSLQNIVFDPWERAFYYDPRPAV